MKRKHVLPATLVVVLAIVCSLLAYAYRDLFRDKMDEGPEPRTVEVIFAGNAPRTMDFSAEATVVSDRVVNVAFEVGGKLENGELPLQQGQRFRQGQLLCQINNREAFAALNKEKTQLAALLLQAMPEIEAQFPAEKNKWIRFMEELKPQFLLPQLPKFNASKERYLLTEKGILTAFYALQQSETRMTTYFFLAPFDGTVLSVSEHPGNVIARHRTVARIATEGPYRISAAIPDIYLDAFGYGKTIRICTAKGDTIGRAMFVHHAGTLSGKTVQHTYNLQPDKQRRLFHGMPVFLKTTAKSTVKTCSLPVAALNGDRVQIVKNGKLQERRVTIAGKENGYAFVSGLEDGEAVAAQFDYAPGPFVYIQVNDE